MGEARQDKNRLIRGQKSSHGSSVFFEREREIAFEARGLEGDE
jgi:hypothetical protein